MDATTKFFLLCAYPDLALDDWITIKGTHVETDESGNLKGAIGNKIQSAKIDAQARALRETANRVDSRKPLDHGQLNIPVEKRGLNAQINAWKKEDSRQSKEERKEYHKKTQERFALEREAKDMLKEHKENIVNYFVKNRGQDPKRARDVLEQNASLHPERIKNLVLELKEKGVL